MARIIQHLPDSAQVALRIYGHRYLVHQPSACQDSELVIPFAKIDKPRLLAAVSAIRPRGMTPIAHSLRQVASDFRDIPGAKIVVLVTDGIEECGGNPSAVVAELQGKELQVKIHVVGFALADQAIKEEMAHLAGITGGLFFDAQDAEQLRKAIEQALTVPYEVRDTSGKIVGGSTLGRGPMTLPGGSYTVVVLTPDRPITIRDVQVAPKRLTKVELKSGGQGIDIRIDGP
jgi:Ca-activated chloride channel family protein